MLEWRQIIERISSHDNQTAPGYRGQYREPLPEVVVDQAAQRAVATTAR